MPNHDDPAPSVELCALAMLVEAWMMTEGPKASLAFLRALAVVVERQDLNVVPLRGGGAEARTHRQAVAWTRKRLTVWLAGHG